MIDNPDGTRRLPTKEEILENVRRNSVRSNNNGSEVAIGTNQGFIAKDRRFLDERRGSSPSLEGRNRFDEGVKGSSYRPNDGILREARPLGNVNSSVDEHSERSPTVTGSERTTYQQPIKVSRFKPYADAIRSSFKKKSTAQKKEPVAKKVLTKQEQDAYKEKLIDVLLWQSEHMDELIKATTKGHIFTVIWSDLDREDATRLATFMLERAKTDRQMAYIVREMISLKDRIELALIILPRVYRTLLTYLERGFSLR